MAPSRRAIITGLGASIGFSRGSWARHGRGVGAALQGPVANNDVYYQFGDSRAACNGDGNVGAIVGGTYTSMDGWLGWLQTLTGYKFYMPRGGMYAVGGTTTQQCYNALVAALSSLIAGATISILTWINDFGQGVPTATTLQYITAILDFCLANGFKVIWLNALPDGSRENNPAAVQNFYDILNFTASVVPTYANARLIDTFTPTYDPATQVSWKAGYSTDGTKHASPLGNKVIGTACAYGGANDMWPGQLFKTLINCPVSDTDIFNSGSNPYGCLNTNFMLEGSGGTALGSNPPTGNIPTGWFVSSNTPGITIQCFNNSIDGRVDPDGFPSFGLSITGTPGGSTGATGQVIIRSSPITVTNIVANGLYAGMGRVIVNSSAAGLYGWGTGMDLAGTDGGGTQSLSGYTFEGFPITAPNPNGQVWYGGAFDEQLMGQLVPVPSDWATMTGRQSHANWHINMWQGVSANINIAISRFGVRPIAA